MKTAKDLFEEAITEWREKKACGTAIIAHPFDYRVMLYEVLARTYARSPTFDAMIIVDTFDERLNIIQYLTNQEDEDNNKEFKKLIDDRILKIFTSSFLMSGKWQKRSLMTIVCNPDSYTEAIDSFVIGSKFRLVLLTKYITNAEERNLLYRTTPLLSVFKQAEMDEIRTSSPVEEMYVPVRIDESSEQYKLLNYYNTYVTTSINVFGSFDIIKQARVGNTELNISSTQICNQIAYENGWNENLDMSVEYNRQIDEIYNPNNIRDRASMTYEIIRNRTNLLSDYDLKLDAINEIVEKHKGEKILIINKRGEFASKVTDHINMLQEFPICGNYHDKVDNIIAKDDYGNVITYKSGKKKGQPRELAAQAQKSLNVEKFNLNKLSILSTSNAPDKELNITVDVVIITSPLCDDIHQYLYRLSNVYFKSPIKLYSIYCKNTLEEKALLAKITPSNHTIVNKSENNVQIENNSDFVIVD